MKKNKHAQFAISALVLALVILGSAVLVAGL